MSLRPRRRLRYLLIPAALKLWTFTKAEWSDLELADALGSSQSALSQHLAKFRYAIVVDVRRNAQNVYYSCSSPEILKMMAKLEGISNKSVNRKTVA